VAFTPTRPSTQTSTAAGTPSGRGPAIYTVTFHIISPFSGSWTVNFDGTNYTSTNPQITIPCAAGQHTYSITPPAGYQLSNFPQSATITVTGNTTYSILLSPVQIGAGGVPGVSASATTVTTTTGGTGTAQTAAQPSIPCAIGFSGAGITICFDPLINAIVTDFNGVIVQPLEAVLGDSLSELWSDVTSAFTGLHDLLNSLWNDVRGAVGAIYNYLQTQVAPALGGLWSELAKGFGELGGAISGLFGQVGSAVGSGLSGLVGFIDNGLNDVKSAIANDLGQAWAAITGYLGPLIGDTEHLVGNLTQITTTAFNQLFSGFQEIIVDIDKGLETFATDVWNGMQFVWNKMLSPALSDVEHAIGDFFNMIGNSLTSLIRDIEDIARGNIVDKLAEVSAGIGTSAVVAVTGLTLAENANPTSNMRFVEALRTALEISGIAAIPGLVNGLIMDTALAKPLTYYFNYQIQPNHMPPQEAARALWYGTIDQNKYAEELRYEGFSDEAINAFLQTAYRPMPAFFLEKLAELQVVSNDFILRQLMMEGYPPDQVQDILTGFQNLELQGFQNNAKALIYEMYKSGYIDNAKATQILQAFSVPATQIKWILYMADREFEYEQKVEVQTMILDGISRGAWTPEQAKNLLIQLGMNANRADTLVKVKSIMAAPELPKSARAELMQKALGLTLPSR